MRQESEQLRAQAEEIAADQHTGSLYREIYIYLACLLDSLYPINEKTADLIEHIFCRPQLTLGNVNGQPKFKSF